MDRDYKVFQDRLREYMTWTGDTIVDLAKMIGVSRQTFSKYLNGNYIPRIEKVQKLADHFGIEVADFYRTSDLTIECSNEEYRIIKAYRTNEEFKKRVLFELEMLNE